MYDFNVIVLGGGPAGMSAAIHAVGNGLSTLLIERLYTGGQAAKLEKIENYPGFPQGISGAELTDLMDEQMREANVRILHEEVISVDMEKKKKIIKTTKGEYSSDTVIIATGSRPRELGLENERSLKNMGVYYSASKDAQRFKGKIAAITGSGDEACREALILSKVCNKVCFVCRRGSLNASKTLSDAVKAAENIEVAYNCVVAEIVRGLFLLESVTVFNKVTTEIAKIPVEGLFVALGAEPDSDVFRGQVRMDDDGAIKTDENMATGTPGVFAAGDVRTTPCRRIVTAVGDGAVAAFSANKYITEHGAGV
ncbi:MAG: FAD-dependent oxidoreductase [Bacillota bacterium]|nr:FAD-dependent oxidoreductase [Bacillota bacterium]